MPLNKYFPVNLSLRENVLVLRTSIVPKHESTGFETTNISVVQVFGKLLLKLKSIFYVTMTTIKLHSQ